MFRLFKRNPAAVSGDISCNEINKTMWMRKWMGQQCLKHIMSRVSSKQRTFPELKGNEYTCFYPHAWLHIAKPDSSLFDRATIASSDVFAYGTTGYYSPVLLISHHPYRGQIQSPYIAAKYSPHVCRIYSLYIAADYGHHTFWPDDSQIYSCDPHVQVEFRVCQKMPNKRTICRCHMLFTRITARYHHNAALPAKKGRENWSDSAVSRLSSLLRQSHEPIDSSMEHR